MPVFRGSRYSGCKVTSITGKDQVTRKWLHPREPIRRDSIDQAWISHVVANGEQLDSIVYRYTNNPRRTLDWWVLADVNSILFPLDLEAGMDLMVPTSLDTLKGGV